MSARSRAIQIVGGLIILLLAFQLMVTVLDFWGTFTPSAWTLSYVNQEGRPISEVKKAPSGDSFIEDHVSGPVTVELTLPQCQSYDRYRFRVGPYGKDDTLRQPQIWNVYVQADSSQWMKAGSEMREQYSNNHWYTFPLNEKLSCVRRIRMEITKLNGAGNLFRLFEIQVYRSSFLDWVRGYGVVLRRR